MPADTFTDDDNRRYIMGNLRTLHSRLSDNIQTRLQLAKKSGADRRSEPSASILPILYALEGLAKTVIESPDDSLQLPGADVIEVAPDDLMGRIPFTSTFGWKQSSTRLLPRSIHSANQLTRTLVIDTVEALLQLGLPVSARALSLRGDVSTAETIKMFQSTLARAEYRLSELAYQSSLTRACAATWEKGSLLIEVPTAVDPTTEVFDTYRGIEKTARKAEKSCEDFVADLKLALASLQPASRA